ncbi:MAG: hypothetical protein ACREIA_18870, partial [Opitutaceae bacterium]
LIPLTYITFYGMMNSRRLLGEHLPRGGRRWVWNAAMGVSVLTFSISSCWMLWNRGGYAGFVACGLFLAAAAVVHFRWKPRAPGPRQPRPAFTSRRPDL